MNQDAVKVAGHLWDRGVIHRAIAVARELCRAGIWNGQDHITIYEPTLTFNKLFGISHMSAASLKSGVDYRIDKSVVPHSKPALKAEADGDVLWA